MKISLAICTRNRRKLLETAIRSSLEALNSTKIDAEVLVIDNASSDDTAQYVKQLSDPKLRYVYEEKVGLSHARNCALHTSVADYIGYIDDDSILDAEWFKCAEKIISTDAVVAFGGPHISYFESPPPRWLPSTYGTHLTHIYETRNLQFPREVLHGSNMVFRRLIVLSIGGFNPQLGMVGDSLGYGEEIDLQLKLSQMGHSILFSPNLKIKHRVNPEKYSLGHLIKMSESSGRAAAIITPLLVKGPFNYLMIVREYIWVAYQGFRTPGGLIWKLIKVRLNLAWLTAKIKKSLELTS